LFPKSLTSASGARLKLDHDRDLQDIVFPIGARAEDTNASAEQRAKWTTDVQGMVEKCFAETGWSTDHVRPTAGALMYTHYNLPLQVIMKRIARTVGTSTDTTRDHQFTDWCLLDKFVEEFTSTVPSKVPVLISR
jgi:hypothetical protein